jgi:coenzyme F420-0:L-glutamate ligase/coenzyme F420-1:gamma-L-glutamate ligase
VNELLVISPDGIGEVTEGCDLAGVILDALELLEGDVVVVTSKVVSKAEGRMRVGADREAAITAETVRTVARRGPVRIVENRLGLVMAAAGVDSSNLAVGTIALLPEDPDASARGLRAQIHARTGLNVAVVISDTSGRPWRLGQTDIAIGAAGIDPLESFAGATDGYGNDLAVTEPAVADEIAAAAELASGKLGGRPVTLVRGLGERLLPPGEHGRGARAIVRARASDMFALGTRESVIAALAGQSACFGTPATVDELLEALIRVGVPGDAVAEEHDALVLTSIDPAEATRVQTLVTAYGWIAEATAGRVVLRPLEDPL